MFLPFWKSLLKDKGHFRPPLLYCPPKENGCQGELIFMIKLFLCLVWVTPKQCPVFASGSVLRYHSWGSRIHCGDGNRTRVAMCKASILFPILFLQSTWLHTFSTNAKSDPTVSWPKQSQPNPLKFLLLSSLYRKLALIFF